MDKKYELLADDTIEVEGRTLHRIRALRDFGDVKAGDLGGYIESERNLSHGGTCWVGDEAQVLHDAHVSSNARVGGHARMTEKSTATDEAQVTGDVRMSGKARIQSRARARDHVVMGAFVHVYDDADLSGEVQMFAESKAYGRARLSGYVHMNDYAQACGDCDLSGTKVHAMLLSGRVRVETGTHVGDVITTSVRAPALSGDAATGGAKARTSHL